MFFLKKIGTHLKPATAMKDEIAESLAINYMIWDINDCHGLYHPKDTVEENYEDMMTWMKNRAEWFDKQVMSENFVPHTVTRIGGKTRYDTSTKIADYYKEKINGGAAFESVIIATGENFPDALAGSFFANRNKAPIIMINRNCAADVVSYIKNNIAADGEVYVLGGTGAVPDEWLSDLKYTRLSGQDRYITNLEILKGADVSEGDLLICTGTNYADALSASGLDMPMLLVENTLTNEQQAFLSKGQ